jgi:hypothetical protein
VVIHEINNSTLIKIIKSIEWRKIYALQWRIIILLIKTVSICTIYHQILKELLNYCAMKKRFYACMFLIILSLSCGKDNVKPSADSTAASDAINYLSIIKEAYEAKNEVALQNHVGTVLADNIIKYFYFEKAKLNFTPRLVRLTDASVQVNLNWQGTWTFVNDKEVTRSGVGNLVFHKETMKLTDVEGDNPFLTPAMRN